MKTCLDVTYSCHGTPGNPRGHFGDIFSSGPAMQARRYCSPRDVTTFGFVCFSRTEAASAPVTSSSDLSDVSLLYPVVEICYHPAPQKLACPYCYAVLCLLLNSIQRYDAELGLL